VDRLYGIIAFSELAVLPLGACITFVWLAKQSPPTKRALQAGLLFMVWTNVVGRVVGFSMSMYALFIMGLGIHTLHCEHASASCPNHSVEFLQLSGSVGLFALLFLMPLAVGAVLRPVPR
jgi:hypothetical protein